MISSLMNLIISPNLSHLFYHLIWQNWQSARDGKASKGFDFVPQALLTCQKLGICSNCLSERKKRLDIFKTTARHRQFFIFGAAKSLLCGWLPTLKQMFKLSLLLSCQHWPDCKSASQMMIKSLMETLLPSQGGGVWQKSAQLWLIFWSSQAWLLALVKAIVCSNLPPTLLPPLCLLLVD